ncbi:MAG: DUF4917 family protein [Acidobacteriota bacterium]
MSTDPIPVLDFAQVRGRLRDAGPAGANLLLGNGFSIACDSRYSYRALRQHADGRLPEVSRALLDRLGTDNLEQVLQIVEDARWVAEQCGQSDGSLAATHRQTCVALVQALAADHLTSPRQIDLERDRSSHAVAFMGLFRRIFTTNYDLLLYWTLMKNAGDREEGYNYRDGFRRPEGELFGEFDPEVDTNVFYLHGALHLYESRTGDGEVRARKHVRTGNRGLVTIVQGTFERGDFPLFVAGGRPEQKLDTIRGSSYLKRCYDTFSALSGPLVIFGWSLGDSDRHLLSALAANADLGPVYLSFYGDPESPSNLRLRATVAELRAQSRTERGTPLEVSLFPSPSAAVWG